MNLKSLLFLLAVLVVAASCAVGDTNSEVPILPVSVRITSDYAMPDGQQLSIDEAWLTFGNLTVFGSTIAADDPFLAGVTELFIPSASAHAGHSHGNAEFSGSLPGYQTVPLSASLTVLGTIELSAGHYFDGRLELVPADASNLSSGHPAVGTTLFLLGTVQDTDTSYTLELTVVLTATVAGLELATYVLPDRDNTLEIQVRLGEMLAGLDFAKLADENKHIAVTTTDAPGAQTIKATLKNRLLYVSLNQQ
jgi:hypothetical protein